MGKMEKKGKTDWLEAQYEGYFIKNTRKIAFFEKKNAQKLASFEKNTYICNMKNLLAGDISKTIRTEWR